MTVPIIVATVLPATVSLGLSAPYAAAAALRPAASAVPLEIIHVTTPAARGAVPARSVRAAGRAVASTGRVSSLKVTAESASAVSLSWKNPSFKGFTGVTVRRASGSTAPKSATKGTQVATVGKAHHTTTARGLQGGTTYSFAVFAYSTSKGHKKYGAATKLSTTTVIGPVKGLKGTPKALSVALSWTNPTGKSFAGVMIRRAVGATAPSSPKAGTLVKKVVAPGHSATASGLSATTTYSFSVFAYDKSGRYASGVHLRVTTTVLAPPPSPATSISLTPSDHSVAVSWTLPDDPTITSVMVRRTLGATPPVDHNDGTLVGVVGPSQLSLPDTGLAPNTTYSYAVFTSNNEPTYANGITATTTTTVDTTPPGPVTNVTETATDHAVTLRWTNPANPDGDFAGVLIRRLAGTTAPSPTTGMQVDDTASATTASFTDSNLPPNTTYSYALFSYDQTGNVQSTAGTAEASTLVDTTPPGKVTGVTATETSSSIKLTWVNPTDTDLAGVIIRRNTGDTAPTSPTTGTAVTDTASKSTTTFTDSTGLIGNTDYSYALFAYDTSGNDATGLDKTFTTATDSTPPANVSNVTAIETANSIKLTWTNPTDADLAGVIIRRAAGDTAPTSITDGTSVTDTASRTITTFTDNTGLIANTDYSYALFAYDTSGNVASGVDKTFTTGLDSTPPGNVSAVTATTTTSSIKLTWVDPTDADLAGVVIRRNTGDTAPTSITDGTAVTDTGSKTATTFTDHVGLIANTDYSYALFAYDTSGNNATGVDKTFTTASDSTPPGNVTNLAATETASSIKLTWVNPGDADLAGVVIRRAVGDTAPTLTTGTQVGDTMSPTTTTFTDTAELIGNTDYSYALFAYDTSGNDATGTTDTFTTGLDGTPPANVSNVTATETASTIKLTWVNPSDTDLAGVIIRRNTGDTAPTSVTDGTAVTDTGSKTTTTFTDNTGLIGNTDYSYALFAYDTSGNDATGTDKTFTTARDTTAPGNVTAVTATTTASSIKLTWVNPSDTDLAGVLIRRLQGSTAPSLSTGTQVEDTASPTVTTFTDSTGLIGNTDYSYALFAYDTSGNDATGTDKTFTTATDSTAPGNVTAVTATETSSSIKLTWVNPSDTDLAGVIIRRNTGDTAPTSVTDGTAVTDTGSKTTTTFTDSTGLIGNTDYSYALFAYDTSGNDATGTTDTFTTGLDGTPPANVSNVTATETASTIKLTWVNPSDTDLAGVIIRRNTGDTAPTSVTDGTAVTDTGSKTTTTFTDNTGLIGNTDYSYALFAYDTSGNDATGTDKTFTTDQSPVSGVAAIASTTDTSVTLSWTNPTDTGFSGVIIRRTVGSAPPTSPTDGDPVTDTASATTDTFHDTDTTLAAGTTYTYALFAYDGTGNFSPVATVTVATNP